MSRRKAKLPKGINVRTNPSGKDVYEWQVRRGGRRKREGGFATLKAAQAARDRYLGLLDRGITVEATTMTVGYEQWLVGS